MAILVDPFSEVVVFGKAYPVAWPPQGATSVKALLPTGRHVSHANRLSHTHNSRGGGGKATTLEHYTGKKSGGRTKLEHFGKVKLAGKAYENALLDTPWKKRRAKNAAIGTGLALGGYGTGRYQGRKK